MNSKKQLFKTAFTAGLVGALITYIVIALVVYAMPKKISNSNGGGNESSLITTDIPEVSETKKTLILTKKEPVDFPNGPDMGASVGSTVQFVPNGDGSFGETITATVTAYSGVESCYEAPRCTMASGKAAYDGAVACPRSIKLGTRISIYDPNDKENTLRALVCEDRTAKRYDGRFDIFVGRDQEAYEKALDFGIKQLQVTIYDERFN